MNTSSSAPFPEEVTYYIVVHGIGQQRHNETVLNVINRMAEVRTAETEWRKQEKSVHFRKALKMVRNRQNIEVVSLGMLSSQTGTPQTETDGKLSFKGCRSWAEFGGIPMNPERKDLKTFFQGKLAYGGHNLRFVDFTWSDILSKHFEQTGQGLSTWTNSLIGRYSVMMHERSEEADWIKPLMESLSETMKFAENLLGWRWAGLKKMIFNDYLGDVQVYGENLRVRGEAVRRFHNLMDKLEWSHFRQFYYSSQEETTALNAFLKNHEEELAKHSPKERLEAFETHLKNLFRQGERAKVKRNYVVLAHSLGTVLSMDALLYAFAKRDLYSPEKRNQFVNLPFPGYSRDGDPELQDGYLGEHWIHNVSSFVTLGSPIDKYLTLWWNNYHYLEALPNQTSAADWSPTEADLEKVFHKPEKPWIAHYNYCDEQDPVGHNLDRFFSKSAYPWFFKTSPETEGGSAVPYREDFVFSRYAWTGLAHEKYWGDAHLFRRILQLTVDLPSGKAKMDELEEGHKLDRFWTYWVVILLVYLFPPLTGAMLASVLFSWFWSVYLTQGLEASIVPFVFFISSIYLFRKIIHLSITWRQVVKSKNRNNAKSINKRKRSRTRAFNWVVVPIITVLLLTLSGLQLLALLAERTELGIPVVPYEKQSMLYILPILSVVLPLLTFFIRRKIARIPPKLSSIFPDILSAVIFMCSGLAGYKLFLLTFLNPDHTWLYPWHHSLPAWLGTFLCFGYLSWLFAVFSFLLARRRFKNLEVHSKAFALGKAYR